MMIEEKKLNVFKIIKEIIFSILLMAVFSVVQFVATGSAIALSAIYAIVKAMGGDDYYLRHSIMSFATGKDGMMLATLLAGLATSILFGMWWIIRSRNYGMAKLRFKRGIKTVVSKFYMIILITLAVYGAVEIVAMFESLLLPDKVAEYNELAKKFVVDNVFINILSMSILAPIAEESLFRGVILDHLKGCMNIYAAVLIQAILFGIMHGNIVQGLFVIPMAIAMGLVAIKAGSIVPTIVIHALFNGISYALTFVPDSIAKSLSFSTMLLIIPIMALVLLYNLLPRDEYGQISLKL